MCGINVVGGGGGATLVSYVELTSQTADDEVNFFSIAELLVQARRRQEDLGRQPRFSSHQSQKVMTQLRTTSLATLTGRGCSKTCVAVHQKLYYRALVPQIFWQLRFPYPTFIESRQIEFMGKTRTRTNWKNIKGEIERIQRLSAKMTHSAPKKGYKGQRRNK